MLNSVNELLDSWSGVMRCRRYGTVWGAGTACILGAFGEKEISGNLRGRSYLC